MPANPKEVVNPKPFLAGLIGKPVVVRLKWGMEYKGTRRGGRHGLPTRETPQARAGLTRRFRASPVSNPAGFLMSVDNYMNVQLGNVEEWIDGALAGKLGDEVLIRCAAPTLIVCAHLARIKILCV
jgi:small nuclear ribonucleoprotein F